MVEYILNLNKQRLHIRVDGMSSEACNLDQLTRHSTSTELPAGDKWSWCNRCRRVSAGGVP